MTMPAGKYYVGDLCYIFDVKDWETICDTIIVGNKVTEGEFETIINGKSVRFACYNTVYGDGTYKDEDGNKYSVDSGTIGCIRVDDIPNYYHHDDIFGNIVTFYEDFPTGSDFCVIWFDHIVIDTDPAYDLDDEEGDE